MFSVSAGEYALKLKGTILCKSPRLSLTADSSMMIMCVSFLGFERFNFESFYFGSNIYADKRLLSINSK
jgi:hypothetical protein